MHACMCVCEPFLLSNMKQRGKRRLYALTDMSAGKPSKKMRLACDTGESGDDAAAPKEQIILRSKEIREGQKCVVHAVKYTSKGEHVLTFAELLVELRQKQFAISFGRHLINCLKLPVDSAIFWENPPVSRRTVKFTPWKCVVIAAPSLSGTKADARTFKKHFSTDGQDVTWFPNLGGDSILVVPCPASKPGGKGILNFSHLGAFIEHASPSQQANFWAVLAERLEQKLMSASSDDEPTWMSTAGQGVAWLHARLDSRPKYYNHLEYAKTTTKNVDEQDKVPCAIASNDHSSAEAASASAAATSPSADV
eukprot:m.130520 g.130520  ORF g.130520 m.130520 type:complete len:309 (+) comp17468_c1_seq4:49-975(+)